MKKINIENIDIILTIEGNNIRVRSDKENILLANQNIDNIVNLINHNFILVKNHYLCFARNTKDLFDLKDICQLSLSIVLHFLYLYNSWREMYKKQEYKDLKFDEKDFENSTTHDIIIHYFKCKFPEDWEIKSAVLLNVGLEELKAYYKDREAFYNK